MADPPWSDPHAVIHRVQEVYGHECFACGRDNPLGLALRFVDFADGRVSAAFTPRPGHRGAPGVLHGGIAATALDEILVWAGILTEGVVSVTGTLDLRYRRPLTVDREIVARGKVDDRSGRRLRLSGSLELDGRPAVEGSGIYLVSESVADLG
jgi:acyl-coenzyme A thioesterase PaaI-like protein